MLLLLGSGPVGDDDLWYHHILVTLCFLCLCLSVCLRHPRPLSWPSQLAPGLPAGSRALPAGSRALLAGCQALSAGFRAHLACSEILPAGSRALPTGSRVLPAGSEDLPAGSRALPAGSKPPLALLCGGTIGHRPLRGRCPLTIKLTD